MTNAHEDPAFQAMCREHEIEGTAQVALCGEFWNRALASTTGEAAPSQIYWHNPQNGQVWSDTDVRFHCKDTTGWSRVVIPATLAAPGAAIAAREQEADAFLRQMASLPGTVVRNSRDLSPQAIIEARASSRWLALRDGLGFAIMAEHARQATEDEQSACAKCSSPGDCGRLGCAATASSGAALGAVPYPMIPPNYLHKDGLLWELVGDHQRAVTVLERDYSARMLDRHIENMMRAYVDADRAPREEAPPTPAAAMPAAPRESREYPPLPAREDRPAMNAIPYRVYTEAQMHAYVDADRKERQLSACNFCLSQAAEARASLTQPTTVQQALSDEALIQAVYEKTRSFASINILRAAYEVGLKTAPTAVPGDAG